MRQDVVAAALDHGDDRQRGDLGIDVGCRDAQAVLEAAREPGHEVPADAAELAVDDLGLGPRADDRAVLLVQVRELVEPRAERDQAVAVGGELGEVGRELDHALRHVERQRAEEVLLVREVQVEGAVGRLRGLHDVVDAGGVQTALGEDGGAGVEQAAQGTAPAGPQLAALGRDADTRRAGVTGSRAAHPGEARGR